MRSGRKHQLTTVYVQSASTMDKIDRRCSTESPLNQVMRRACSFKMVGSIFLDPFFFFILYLCLAGSKTKIEGGEDLVPSIRIWGDGGLAVEVEAVVFLLDSCCVPLLFELFPLLERFLWEVVLVPSTGNIVCYNCETSFRVHATFFGITGTCEMASGECLFDLQSLPPEVLEAPSKINLHQVDIQDYDPQKP